MFLVISEALRKLDDCIWGIYGCFALDDASPESVATGIESVASIIPKPGTDNFDLWGPCYESDSSGIEPRA
jgi:hypothetical protein